jgi:hypothetical protein
MVLYLWRERLRFLRRRLFSFLRLLELSCRSSNIKLPIEMRDNRFGDNIGDVSVCALTFEPQFMKQIAVDFTHGPREFARVIRHGVSPKTKTP